MAFSRRDIWRLATGEAAIWPEDTVAATINGDSINRHATSGVTGGESVYLTVQCGAATVTPSTQTVDGKIQDSPDDTTWADVGDAITALSGDDESGNSPGINCSNLDKFIRAVIVVAFSGGSTPTIPVGATLTFGGRE